MDSKEKKIYLEANQLYKQGKPAEASKLWMSLADDKQKKRPEISPIVWSLVSSISFFKMHFLSFFAYSLSILTSLFLGKFAAFILFIGGDLLRFKNYPAIYNHLQKLAQTEIYVYNVVDKMEAFKLSFSDIFSLLQNYFSLKIFVIQNLFTGNHSAVSIENPLQHIVFNSSFVGILFLIMIGFAVDIFFVFKFCQICNQWLLNIFKTEELKLRFFISIAMVILCASFYIVVYQTFKKPESLEKGNWLSLLESGQQEQNGASSSDSFENETEQDFLKSIHEQLLSSPLSIAERKAIKQMVEDYVKLLEKYNVGNNGQKGLSPQEVIEKLKNGNLEEIEKDLQRRKALQEYERLKGEYGSNENELSKEDKEFSEILKKSFKGSNKNTIEEFLKTNKEFEELYGKKSSDKFFNENKEKLLKEFSKDSQKARESIREQMRNLADQEMQNETGILKPIDNNAQMRIHSIINYLETGGDIKIFNQMRLKFLKDFTDPFLRLEFALRVDFVIASWNEHQNKYFWQMNRALMMEVVDMITAAAKATNMDIRRAHLGWFYLVSGYYKKAREECLKSLEISASEDDLDNEGAYINRSNAALAALMMQEGKTAYVEYRSIYQTLMSNGQGYTKKREELFTEYIREITASLASDTPCKEAYLCRSLFLEEVNDELALTDLLKYLSLSPTDSLLLKEAKLKADLIKERIAQRAKK